MHRTLLIAVAASLALTACDRSEKFAETVATVPEDKPKPLKEVDPVAYHSNVDSAMTEISPELRPQFQKLFICEMKRNNKLPQPKPVTAEYIRSLTDHLKANPTAGDTCNA